MKVLKIVIRDLKNFICQKKYIFSILIIGLIVASYSLSFFTAQSLHIVDLVNTYFGYSTKYYIGGRKEKIDNQKFENLIAWLDQNNLNKSKLNIYSEMIEIQGENHNETCVIVGSNSTKSNRSDFVGKEITEEDLNNKSNYILVEYYSEFVEDDPFLLNKNINIGNKSYIVKAIDKIDYNKNIYFDCNTKGYYKDDYESHLSMVCIPYTTFLKNEYDIFSIEIIFEQPLSETQRVSLNNLIKDNFNENLIVKPVKTNTNNMENIKDKLIEYSVIILVALINIMALFSYWIDKNWRNYMIYKLCGARNSNIYFIIILEAISISVISSIVGILLYYITVPLLQKIYISYVLSIKEIICIQSIIVFLVFILTNINILQIFKRNSKYIGRR